jgi:uridine kinase
VRHNGAVHASVIVLAGPSGSGKSRLCARLGLPVLRLDDYYKDGSDPTLPHVDLGGGQRLVDWDDPRSWLRDDAVDAVERLCAHGEAEVPVYDIARDGRTGHRKVRLGEATYFVAEGIFAQEVVTACRERNLLAAAICLDNRRSVTFSRRLSRDLREHRKPPLVLLRRGLRLMRLEPDVVRHAVALGCTPMTSDQAYRRLSTLLGA